MENKQETEQKIESLKKEIHSVSSELKELSNQKEEHYKQKTFLDNQLNKLISKAKQCKDKKQETDKKIRELKQERDSANKSFNRNLTDLRSAQRNRREIIQKSNIVPSSRLRAQIKELEYKIQTEALKFDKEKQIMSWIKKIKVELEKSVAQENTFKEIEEFRKQSKTLKSEADNFHKQIQKYANESSDIFNELTKLSRDIADIKAKRNTVQIVLKELKSQINQRNQKLSKILKEWSGISDHIIKKRVRKGFELIQKKTEDVKQKFKDKKKLTTEDILLLQREAMGK